MLECTWLSGGCRPPGAANSDRGSCPKGSEEEEKEEEEEEEEEEAQIQDEEEEDCQTD